MRIAEACSRQTADVVAKIASQRSLWEPRYSLSVIVRLTSMCMYRVVVLSMGSHVVPCRSATVSTSTVGVLQPQSSSNTTEMSNTLRRNVAPVYPAMSPGLWILSGVWPDKYPVSGGNGLRGWIPDTLLCRPTVNNTVFLKLKIF